MVSIEVLSNSQRVKNRFDHLVSGCDVQDGNSLEKVFELITANEITAGLRKQYDVDSKCQICFVKLARFMELMDSTLTTVTQGAETK